MGTSTVEMRRKKTGKPIWEAPRIHWSGRRQAVWELTSRSCKIGHLKPAIKSTNVSFLFNDGFSLQYIDLRILSL